MSNEKRRCTRRRDMQDRTEYLLCYQQYDPETLTDNRIKKLRIEAGLTVEQLCKKIGASAPSVTRLELGQDGAFTKKGKLTSTAQKLLDFFEVDPYEMFPREYCTLYNLPEFIPLEDCVPLESVRDSEIIRHSSLSISRETFWLLIDRAVDVYGRTEYMKVREKEVLKMKYLEGLPAQEISARLGISLARAHQMVKTALYRVYKACHHNPDLKKVLLSRRNF